MHKVSTKFKVFRFLHKGSLGNTNILSATSETVITFLAFYLYMHFHAVFNCWYTLHGLYKYFFQGKQVSFFSFKRNLELRGSRAIAVLKLLGEGLP